MEEVISAKVDKKTKDKMKRFSDVNWSEVIRGAIAEKIRQEELRRRARSFDSVSLAEAAKATDAIRAKQKAAVKEGWSAVEEIRKWREIRR